jgi:hypothetical protein
VSRGTPGARTREDFTEGSVIRAVTQMGLPSMIGFAAASIYDIVNMLWVSRLPGAPVAAITFFFPFYWLLTSVNQIAGSGSVAMIARRYGERDDEGAEAAIKDAILLKILLALAVAASHHAVPLYVVAPTTTLDPTAAGGADIPIEERASSEITARFPARNPAFDVTPAGLIAAIVTEEGIHRPPYAASLLRVVHE